MTPLQSRKQLLLSESELNRVLMVQDMTALATEGRALAARAKTFGSIASSAGVVLAGLAAYQRGKAAHATTKRSWFQNLLRAASVISTIWLTFRSRHRHRDGV